jgi:hypothetical protein
LDYFTGARQTETSYIQYKEGKLTALVTFWIGTAFQNTLLKERWEKDVCDGKTRKVMLISYWMILKKWGHWKLKEAA